MKDDNLKENDENDFYESVLISLANKNRERYLDSLANYCEPEALAKNYMEIALQDYPDQIEKQRDFYKECIVDMESELRNTQFNDNRKNMFEASIKFLEETIQLCNEIIAKDEKVILIKGKMVAIPKEEKKYYFQYKENNDEKQETFGCEIYKMYGEDGKEIRYTAGDKNVYDILKYINNVFAKQKAEIIQLEEVNKQLIAQHNNNYNKIENASFLKRLKYLFTKQL